ncbi:hypothetical protein [Sedimentisphaera salicampi]|uniref:Uncharacterized protein n=1 Tax=Sedimentisphaera salicampi TaxID=1941349 RepID=A0A1W6LQ17_9BACT|nr:hypothetical protein [Sedimentisphaera salicampi]ARN57864.1 hypothetical protein STSP1_02290 [Sedimentisphaera salicampi]OXU14032.1 hypothetical protein SMSP1_02194 [Sedimentisphaera salicampi]
MRSDFKFYSDMIGNATKKVAGIFLAVGLALLGFSILLFVFKMVFIFIAAAVFIAAGIWCVGTAIKIFMSVGGSKYRDSEQTEYRENVRIHYHNR